MFQLAILASVFLPAVLLYPFFLVAQASRRPVWIYLSLFLASTATAAGLYLLGQLPGLAVAETSDTWFVLRYTLGLGLFVPGTRLTYKSWQLT